METVAHIAAVAYLRCFHGRASHERFGARGARGTDQSVCHNAGLSPRGHHRRAPDMALHGPGNGPRVYEKSSHLLDLHTTMWNVWETNL